MNERNDAGIYGEGYLIKLPEFDFLPLMLVMASPKPFVPWKAPEPAGQTESRSGFAQTNVNQAQASEFPNGPSVNELLRRREWQKFILTQTHDHFVQTRTALASRLDFKLDNGWPTKILRNECNRKLGTVLIQPPRHILDGMLEAGSSETDVQVQAQQMAQTCSPLTADVIDLLIFLLLDPKNSLGASFSIDAILAARNLQKHRGGKNANGEAYRGGYTKEQRQDVAQQIELLSWVQVRYTNAIVYRRNQPKELKQGNAEPLFKFSEIPVDKKRTRKGQHWSVEPFETLQEILAGGFVGYLPLQVMQYNPAKRAAEKAIARHLFARWRRAHKQGVKDRRGYSGGGLLVQDLLNIAGISVERHHPGRAEERLSEALIQLMDDGLIKERGCQCINKLAPGWVSRWLQDRIDIHPTDEFVELRH
ncbi:MAG TPA: hypothetical protein VE954_13565 [Oligoflexus sp.]|uniref:hypothetical protein n=1 Tax=Oligoflexus sp. TaxID=1971216 RepID=UPI002D22A9DA|nr:hypothetical protein [Oligoflexus sp.]HYX34131.1 hypothetical protein [Oligoflexus sp.]